MAKGLTERHKLIILVVLVGLVVLVAGVRLVIQPLSGKLGVARPKITKKQTELERVREQLARLGDLEKALADRRQAYAPLAARLSTGALDTVLADLSAMAQEAHLRLESVEPMMSAPTARRGEPPVVLQSVSGIYTEVPLKIVAKGGYHQLGAFVSTLENNQRLMRLRRLEIAAMPDEPWRQSVQLIVSVYQLIEPSIKAAP